MQPLVIALGLFLAACGHALLHDWRGAIAVYEELDGRFPPGLQTPTAVAGPLMLLSGAACALAPMLG